MEYEEYAMYINGVFVDRFEDISDEIYILDDYLIEKGMPYCTPWETKIRTGLVFDFKNEENNGR